MNKQSITKLVLDNLPEKHAWSDLPFEKILFQWWATGRSQNSLRLTDDGKHAFDQAEIVYYEYPLVNNDEELEEVRQTKFILELGKKINCPFYVGYKTRMTKSIYVRLYDSKIAMLINLYGSFHDYLQAKKI